MSHSDAAADQAATDRAAAAHAAALRAEMKALNIKGPRPSLPTMIVGLLACVNTASAIATLAFL